MRHVHKRAREMEEAFFRRREAEQLAKRRDEQARRERLAALREASGCGDEALLNEMLEHNLRPETIMAFRLIPLIEVVWADGHMHPDERGAVLKAVEQDGMAPGSLPHAMVEEWLDRRPPRTLVKLWKAHVADLRTTLPPQSLQRLRATVVGRARAVARAAGGFLGFGRISAEEEAVLKDLEKAFGE